VRTVVVLVLLAAAATAQAPRVGVIDFHGPRKVSEALLRKALGVREGDPLPRSKGEVEGALETVPGVVRARLEATCCEDGKAILYVGIEEKGAPHFDYHQPPDGEARIPDEIHGAYARFLASVHEAARVGETGEDLSQGHSLMHNAASREIQIQFPALVESHLVKLREVLRTSADEEHRAMSAYIIGYAKNKRGVVEDLQYALRDPDDTVRNNALRALGAITVLATRDPAREIRISPTWLIEMLNSLIWQDRHTAAVTLVTLTERRDESVMAHIRERAIEALAEMARWKHLPHALPAFILLGRLAGMPEVEIQKAWTNSDRESVVRRALAGARPTRR